VITYQTHRVGEGLRITVSDGDGHMKSVEVYVAKIYDGIGRIGADFRVSNGKSFRLNSPGNLIDLLDGKVCSFRMRLEGGSFEDGIVRVRYKFHNLGYSFTCVKI
jgi:hypothetical protein